MANVARTSMPGSLGGRLTSAAGGGCRDNWALKSGARYPSSSSKLKTNRRLPVNNTSKSQWQWKYSKAQLKAHMMLPEPLPIPKSVLYDYKKKKTTTPSRTSHFQHDSYYRNNSNFWGRSASTESSMTSSDSGADDLSDTSSEHSEWDSIFFLDGAVSSGSDDYCQVPSSVASRVNADVVALPLSPAIERRFAPSAALLRPLSPAASISSCSSSGSKKSTTTTSTESSSSSSLAVDMGAKSSPLGQLLFQCARCFIIYPKFDVMEEHIGQFHVRPPEGEVFRLSEDNFSTLVKAVWDADLNYGLYAGCVSHCPEPALAHFEWAKITPPADCHFDECGTEQLAPSHPPHSHHRTLSRQASSSSLASDTMDSGMDTDGSESFIDDLSVGEELVFDEDILMNFDLPGSSSSSGPSSPLKKSHSGSSSRLVFTGKSGNGMTRKLFADAMKKVNKIIAVPGKSSKQHHQRLPLDMSSESYQRQVPKKMKVYRERVNGADGGDRASDKMARLNSKKNMRKCRGVYGIDNQDKWCNMCKWKKRCSRFSNADNDKEEE